MDIEKNYFYSLEEIFFKHKKQFCEFLSVVSMHIIAYQDADLPFCLICCS